MNNLVERVERLVQLDLAHGAPATVGPVSLDYTGDMDTNFEDYMAFSSAMNRFIEESVSIKRMKEMVSEGRDQHCNRLYCWRPIARAFSGVQDDNPRRLEIYATFNKILTKAMDPLFKLYEFAKSSHSEFIALVSKTCKPESQQEGISDGILVALGEALDMFSTLDDLKNAKTSVTNDYAFHKRVKSIIKAKTVDVEATQYGAKMAFFLAQPNQIITSIKGALGEIPDSSKLIALIIAKFCYIIDNKLYTSSIRRFAALRIILACLFLISTEKSVVSKLEAVKVPLARLDRIFRETPSIPLIGDMHSNVVFRLKGLNFGYEWTLLDTSQASKNLPSFNLLSYLELFETEHISLVSEFSQMLNSPRILSCNNGICELSRSDAAEIYRLVLRSLRSMGKWNFVFQVVFLYKLCHPVDRSTIGDVGEQIDQYSLATRYNYSPQEKSAMARVIFYIKSLGKLLRRNECLLTLAVDSYMYNVIQSFANSTIVDLQRKAEKSKSQLFKRMVDSLRIILTDRVDPLDFAKLKKGEKTFVVKNKAVPPLSTQLYMAETMLRSLVSQKETRKNVDSHAQQQIANFLSDVAFFSEMSNLPLAIEECEQLRQLWFKEFYIELSARECIHYPIEDSAPSFITRSLIEGNEPNMYEYVLYCTSIYDDAAQYVLQNLKRRHLYDEINTEAQLHFQQLCYYLPEKLYSIMRAEAFSTLYDKSVKNSIVRCLVQVDKTLNNEFTVPYQSAHQIANLCRQGSVQYLGHNIHLNSLFSQRLEINLKRSLEVLIGYFEASTLESVVLVSGLLDIYRQTHANISRYFSLRPFKCILAQANGDIPGYLPRITTQILNCLLVDLASNYSYSLQTDRFVRSPLIYTDARFDPPKIPIGPLYGTKAMANAFEDYFSLYHKYVGPEHFRAVFRLIGYGGLTAILEDLKSAIAGLVSGPLKEYITVLRNGMPITCILSRVAYTFEGAIQYFNMHFESVLKYQDLRPGVLHNFCTLGNYLIIFRCLARFTNAEEGHSVFFTAPFSGVLSTKASLQDPSSTDRACNLMKTFKYCMVEKLCDHVSDERFNGMLRRASLLNQERLCCGLSPFSGVLRFLQEKLDDPIWTGPEPQNGVISIVQCVEYHRIASLLFYYLTLPVPNSDIPYELEFGDGVLFGPLAIIVCLGQHHRYEALDLNAHAISIADVDGSQSLTMSLSAGTTRNTMTLTRRSPKDSQKSDLSEESKQILSNMKSQALKQRAIIDTLVGALSHHSSTYTQVVKCFHPPVFTP